ncbi:MAG: TetR/AcrR family transcriptional regulator, partial [Lactobacillus iners]|nr:TetR/AcrR family transcriptional regulator [Lactobacillus iners]
MVKKTFINLNSAKKQKIEQVMLDEFSNYDLNQANVARIVKEAGIARGAFYTYFDDLEDAYLYVYNKAMLQIHNPIKMDK